MKTSINVIAAVIASTLSFSVFANTEFKTIVDDVRNAAIEPQGINVARIQAIALSRLGIHLTEQQALSFGSEASIRMVTQWSENSDIANRIGYSGEPAPTPLTAPTTTTPTEPAVSSQTVNTIKNASLTDSIQAGQLAAAASRAALEGAQLTAAAQTRTQMQSDALQGAQLTAANQARTQMQSDALQGAQLNHMNQYRTETQAVALADARQAAQDRADHAAAVEASNRTRTQIQVDALKGAQLTAANQTRTAQQAAALKGAQLTAANQARTAQQAAALKGAQLTQMNIDRVKTQVVGRPTFTETVPAVVLNKPLVKNSAPFQTAKGTGGNSKGQASQHAGGSGHGENNAGSHAFGGHGYGANNTGSEGFGGGSQFH